MTTIARGRFTADPDPDPDEHAGLVLFHIGMRINRLGRPRTWLPVLLAMPRMLRELSAHPELGLLSFEVFRSGRTFLVVQYWRDFASLDAWALRRRTAPAGLAGLQPRGPPDAPDALAVPAVTSVQP